MASYTIDYSDLSEPQAMAKGLEDVKDWFGMERFNSLCKTFKEAAPVPLEQFSMMMSFGGVQGFPIYAFYKHLYGEEQFDKAFSKCLSDGYETFYHPNGCTRVMFESPQFVEERDVPDWKNSIFCRVFKVKLEQLDWRDPQELWIWDLPDADADADADAEEVQTDTTDPTMPMGPNGNSRID